jgi:hypothetical protein
MVCLILTSCTDGNTTIIVTNPTQSPTLVPYIGFHVPIVGYPGICFSVESVEIVNCPCTVTQQTPVEIDKTNLSKTNVIGQNLCGCTVPFTCYILTPCDPALPTFYTEQNLNPYVGTTITFFGQDGTCYTVTGSLNIPTTISVVAVNCITTCECVLPVCGCPDGFTLNVETGLCDGILETTPTASQYTLEVIPGSSGIASYGFYGADFYANIDALSKPLLPVKFGVYSPPTGYPYTKLKDFISNPCIIVNTVVNSLWQNRSNIIGVWASGFEPGVPQGPIGLNFCYEVSVTKEYYIGIAADDSFQLYIDSVLIVNHLVEGWAFTNFKILPITLSAGQHVIELVMQDTGSAGSFIAFELYDVPSYAVLQACTTANNTPGATDLNQYIIFSTLEKKTPPGQTWDSGLYYGYNCPVGYALNTCGLPMCVQNASIAQTPCFTWQITFCDGTGLEPIITSTDLALYVGGVYTICYTDGEVNICACGSVTKIDAQEAPAFTGTFSEIAYDCCEKCMQTCYLLTDCQGAVDPIITCTDLSQYVNMIVKLSHCGNICWKVEESETCDGSILLGNVVNHFVPEPVIKTKCIYKINVDKAFINDLISYSIVINGTLYEYDYIDYITLLSDLNDLNLGTFYSTGLEIGVTGTEEYGLLCLIRKGKPKICTEPVCTTYTQTCSYIGLELDDNKLPSPVITITINAQSYTHTFNNRNVLALLAWLNSLNLGTFGGNIISGIFYITVYDAENYGNIVNGETITLTTTCSVDLDFVQACTDCLPPLPPAPVFDLHLRRIKPGYFSTNSCITTEYMERVNCNFAKQVYDDMLIRRYGITVCCDHDVNSWDIKKQVLDLELLGDPSLCKSTICYCLAPCLIDVIFTLTPVCLAPALIDVTFDNLCYPPEVVDVTICAQTTELPCNCYVLVGTSYTVDWLDCCGDFQSTTFTNNSTICAHYIPVIRSGSVVITSGGDCGSVSCVAPPPICRCYNVIPKKAGSVVSYDTCNGIPVTVTSLAVPIDNTGVVVPYSMCSSSVPVAVFPTSVNSITPTGFCNVECGLTSICYCYQIVVTSTNLEPATIQVNTNACDGVIPPNVITSTVTSGTDLYICSKRFPVVTSATPNASINIKIRSTLNCLTGDCVAP